MSPLFSKSTTALAVTTSEGVADVIRREILSGKLEPGQPLMERAIAKEIGVSRTPVREALFALHGEGLVELSPRKYARVRKVTSSDISQIYSLRRVLEAHAASNAAIYADDAARLEIEIALIRQKNLSKDCSAIEQADADLAFHAAIAAASGNQLLKTVTNQVLAITATLRSRYKYDSAMSKRALSQHKAILSAIKAENADRAADLISDHISSSEIYSEETSCKNKKK